MLTTLMLAGAVIAGAGAAHAEDTKDKVKSDARSTGKTVLRGTSGVGKGGSKIYHDAASKFHKVVAKNSKSDRTKAKHLGKSAIHHSHATRKAAQSEREMNKAEKHAEKVGK